MLYSILIVDQITWPNLDIWSDPIIIFCPSPSMLPYKLVIEGSSYKCQYCFSYFVTWLSLSLSSYWNFFWWAVTDFSYLRFLPNSLFLTFKKPEKHIFHLSCEYLGFNITDCIFKIGQVWSPHRHYGHYVICTISKILAKCTEVYSSKKTII